MPDGSTQRQYRKSQRSNPVNASAPPTPSKNKICPTGNTDDKSFITISSRAKVAIATTIKKLPRKFSFWMILMVKVAKPSSVVAVQNLAKLEMTLNLIHDCRFWPIVQCKSALCFLSKLDRPLRRSFFNWESYAQNECQVHF